MKKLSVLLLLVLSVSLLAQNGYDESPSPLRSICIGGGLNFKAGYNLNEMPASLTNALGFGFDIDALFFMPISEDKETSLLINVSYASYPFGLTSKVGTKEITQSLNFKYLAVGGEVVYNNFIVGLNLGLFPLSASMSIDGNSTEFATDVMGSVIDARIGYMFPFYQDESSVASITGKIGYAITPILKENIEDTNNLIQPYNYHPLYFALGINYLFKTQ